MPPLRPEARVWIAPTAANPEAYECPSCHARTYYGFTCKNCLRCLNCCGDEKTCPGFDLSREIDRLAQFVFFLRTMVNFGGRDPDAPLSKVTDFDRRYPASEKEKKLVARWHEFDSEEREMALERVLIRFKGGVLLSALEKLDLEKPKPASHSPFEEKAKWSD